MHKALQRGAVAMPGCFTLGFCVMLACILLARCAPSPAHAQTLPHTALQHRAELTRTAHSQWGLGAPVATFAAQIHQESSWNPLAVSRVGAAGMAQFMPATARWWCQINGLSATACQPTNPTWALRALVGYNKWLHDRVAASDECNMMAFTLSAYNGGLGWVQRDKVLAHKQGLHAGTWFNQVETVNAGRSAANWRENRDYPQRILRKLEPAYVRAGWGAGACS